MAPKRTRAEPTRFVSKAPLQLKAPPAKYIGRACCLRWPGTEQWITATIVAYSGPDKQTVELDVDDTAGGGSTRHTKVNLATQPIHAAKEVAWGAEDANSNVAVLLSQNAVAGSVRPLDKLGQYVPGLIPFIIFAPLGPPELEAEDGDELMLSLKTNTHVWRRTQGMVPVLPYMMRRRTAPVLKKAVTAALEAHKAINAADARSKKKAIVGKRIAVYWPDDDAWYSGVIHAWDAKESKHTVLYDDQVLEPIVLADEIHHIYADAEEEERVHTFSMHGPCFYCTKPGRLCAEVIGGAPAADFLAPDGSIRQPLGKEDELARCPEAAPESPSAANDLPPGKRPKVDSGDAEAGTADAVGAVAAATPRSTLGPAVTVGAAVETILCTKCGGGDETGGNDILLCDGIGCGKCFHQQCCSPPVTAVPENEWLCAPTLRPAPASLAMLSLPVPTPRCCPSAPCARVRPSSFLNASIHDGGSLSLPLSPVQMHRVRGIGQRGRPCGTGRGGHAASRYLCLAQDQ